MSHMPVVTHVGVCVVNRGGSAVYRLLGVASDASAAEVKSAYRKAALKVHPDVSDAPDATQQFTELSAAYGELPSCMCCLLTGD